MPMTPREMVKLLEKNGWKPKGNNGGSHRKFENPRQLRSLSFHITRTENSKRVRSRRY